ncbi:hypothetical protein D6783_01625 [Candidatus Woesearchaeota archaeon]|nr:MAG: hypothetical protein D6783_01625 [Candidatus Woesearchaeota archaeon]
MQKDESQRFVNGLVVLFCVMIVLQSALLIFFTHVHVAGKAVEAQGEARLCINYPPSITIPCNTTFDQGDFLFCVVNGSDPENATLTFTSSFVTNVTVFTISSSGVINVTLNATHVGNHTAIIFGDDGAGCSNSVVNDTYRFNVSNINDPPYLAVPVPNVTLDGGTSLSAYFLDDYFADYDGDPLTYTVAYSPDLSVTIFNSSEVRYSHPACTGDAKVYPVVFTAWDPYNLSADSNVVSVQVVCTQQASSGGSSGSSGGGGGGGGGGALCNPEWNCLDWLPCLPNGTRWRRCIDMNECEVERYLKGACVYGAGECEEDWSCTDWGPCTPENKQFRSCDDKNACGSEVLKPFTERVCEYVPTCDDGVQNGGEIGVDCGGPCAPCLLLEFPQPVQPTEGFFTTALFVLFVLLLFLLVFYVLFRRKIRQWLALLGWWVSGRRSKVFLLSKEEKEQLLKAVRALEREIDQLSHNAGRLFEAARKYLFFALDLEEDFTREDFLEAVKKASVPESLKQFLVLFERRVAGLEKRSGNLPLVLKCVLEEFRTLIVSTAEYTLDEVRREVQELEAPAGASAVERIRYELVNTYVALQFGRIGPAKRHYLTILNLYHPLTEAQRELVYYDITRLYYLIKYMGAYLRPS